MFEADISIPKFSCLAKLNTEPLQPPGIMHVSNYKNMQPTGTTSFKLPYSTSRVAEWLHHSCLTLQQPTQTKVYFQNTLL